MTNLSTELNTELNTKLNTELNTELKTELSNDTARAAPSSRAPIIDALRGVALFGILAVNIQSAVWSLGGPTLGQLDEVSALLDRAAVLFTSFFLEYKFYPIFCFCFGYGFAVQARKWRASGDSPRTLFTRRLTFMLIFGIFHGVFLWFGEILTRYAITGFVLRHYLGRGPRALIKAIKFWVITTVMATLVLGVLVTPGELTVAELTDMNAAAITEITAAKTIYTSGSYLDVTRQRATDFFGITTTFVFLIPQVMLLFLLGAISAQMGWLTLSKVAPDRHRALLTRIFVVSLLVGLPINVAFTIKGWTMANAFSVGATWFDIAISTLVPIFAFTYISGLALIATSPLGKMLIALLAPAGKLALTNYVFQSLAMTFLLYGYGLGWGARLQQGELFILAVVIYAFQLVASHYYLRHYRQGPLEWLWRLYTNRSNATNPSEK